MVTLNIFPYPNRPPYIRGGIPDLTLTLEFGDPAKSFAMKFRMELPLVLDPDFDKTWVEVGNLDNLGYKVSFNNISNSFTF